MKQLADKIISTTLKTQGSRGSSTVISEADIFAALDDLRKLVDCKSGWSSLHASGKDSDKW